jgi:hypothetical protein
VQSNVTAQINAYQQSAPFGVLIQGFQELRAEPRGFLALSPQRNLEG